MLDLLVTGTTDLHVEAYGFLTILLLIFGLFMILAGAFTAYFGSGKSRTIGVVLLVVGLVIGILGAFWYHSMVGASLTNLVWGTFLVLIAAAIGALIAIAIFLVAIMKS
jgi:MFS family permease